MRPLSFLELSSSRLCANISTFKKLLSQGTCLIAVIKANAYGHGLKEVVGISQNLVEGFQVDDIEELREARKYTKKTIFVFGYIQKSDLGELVNLKGIAGVYGKDTIEVLNKVGQKLNKKIKIHLKIDALLGRQGIMPFEVEQFGKFLRTKKFIELEAVYSHFSDIEDTNNLNHAKAQYKVLLQAKDALEKIGFKNLKHHISATSGFLSDTKSNWTSCMVRLGIGMYGLWPSKKIEKKCSKSLTLKPVLRWVSHLAQVKIVPKGFPIGYGQTFKTKREMRIGVVPQGYSDGYDIGFSNNSFVLVNSQKCPVIGRVAMNMIAVDLSKVLKAEVEDEVILLGEQGNECITAEELADKIGTINYEIVARISSLLPRTYLKNNRLQ